MIGFHIRGGGIGDVVQYTSIPENIYNLNKEKYLCDMGKLWCFDHNPYILRDKNPDETVIFDQLFDMNMSLGGGINFLSRFDKFDRNLQLPEEVITLRHPRLYKYEDNIKLGRVGVHVGPAHSRNYEMSDDIVSLIKTKYKDYDAVQIGGIRDKTAPFKDERCVSIWEMTEKISQCQFFIGLDSGPMNIANCYPNIVKKVILPLDNTYTSKLYSRRFRPMYSHDGIENWIDFNWMYYNPTNRDMGITMSYLKL